MILFPAIDIKDGNCVRLYQGRFDTAEQVADNFLQTAQRFERDGAEWIHMVDLDGAKDARPKNREIFLEVARKTNLKVEVGGGIRSLETIKEYLEQGISRVILGSAALHHPELVKSAVERYGEKIAVGIDAKNGFVAAEGWLEGSRVQFTELAKAMEEIGVSTIIFTDISKDGTLSGPNFAQLFELSQAVKCNIVASGGIKELSDLVTLKEMGLYGAICGKSIYQGTLDLAEAIRKMNEKLD